jgi:lipase
MGGRKYNPWPMLNKLKCPVLIVEGEESENKEFIDLKKAVSLLSHGVYKSMAGAGHLLAMQKPQELVKLIKEFNNQIESNIQKGETIHGSQY